MNWNALLAFCIQKVLRALVDPDPKVNDEHL
jgi:hypothetical protein